MDPPAYCASPQMQEEQREAWVTIGIPLTVPPQQMRSEHEAWVAIGVPLTEPLPHRKLSPCEKQTMRCFVIAWGIMSTVGLFHYDGPPLIVKILAACMLWAIPIGILRFTFRSDDLPQYRGET
ncbi:unnamed protein product [Alopecurus aequalis]